MIERYIWLEKDENKHIKIDKAGEYAYFFLVAGGEAKIAIHIQSPHTKVRCAALLISPAKNKKSTVQFSLTVGSSGSRADVLLVSFLTDSTSAQIDGKIDLAAGIENAEGYLSEEVLILGEKVKVKTTPQLFVGSKNVKASHGASIQRLHPEKLFYMRSKGLPMDTARQLLISSYIQKTMQFVGLEDLELLKNIENILKI